MATFIGWANGSINPYTQAAPIPAPGNTTPANFSPSNMGMYGDDDGNQLRLYFGGNDPDGPGVYVWTLNWTPSGGDPAPAVTLAAPNSLYGSLDLGPNFSDFAPLGEARLTCTKDGVPLDGELVCTITSGSVYGDISWMTIEGGYVGDVDFVGTPTEGTIDPGGLPTSSGVVDPTNRVPLLGPTRISQLPIATAAYANDRTMIWRGEPPLTLVYGLGTLLEVTADNVPSNSPVNPTPVVNKRVSDLTLSGAASRQDWVLINQGDPPKTVKVRIGRLLDYLASIQ